MKKLSVKANKKLFLVSGIVTAGVFTFGISTYNNFVKANDQKKLSFVENEVSTLEKANPLEEAENQVRETNAKVESANEEVKKANAAKEEASKEMTNAKEALKNALNAQKAAEAEVKAAKTPQEKKVAEEKVKAAKELVKKAEENKIAAESKLEEAKKSVQQAEEAKQAAEIEAQKAIENKEALENNIEKKTVETKTENKTVETKTETKTENKTKNKTVETKVEKKNTQTNKTTTNNQDNGAANQRELSAADWEVINKALQAEQERLAQEGKQEVPEEHKVEFHFYTTNKNLTIHCTEDYCGNSGYIWFIELECDLNKCEGFTDSTTGKQVSTLLVGKRADITEHNVTAPAAKPGYKFVGWELISSRRLVENGLGEKGYLTGKYIANYEKIN